MLPPLAGLLAHGETETRPARIPARRPRLQMTDAHRSPTTGAFRLVLEEGPPDMLGLVLGQCGARTLLRSVCPVSKLFAACAEPILRSQCEVFGWRLPKSSRLAYNSDYPWRALYAARSCRECATQQGDFAIRRSKNSHPEFYREIHSNPARLAPSRRGTQPFASAGGSVRPVLQGAAGGAQAAGAEAHPRRDGSLAASKPRPVWPGSAAQVADWRRLAGAWDGLWHDLVPTQPPDSHQLAEARATLFSNRPLGQAAVYEEGRLVLRCRLRLLGRCARHSKRRACRAPAAVG